VRRKSEVAHVVEDQQIVFVLRKRLHQRRHAEVRLATAADVPRWRVHTVRLEQRHETDRRFILLSFLRRGLHQIQKRQRQRGTGRAAKKRTSIESKAHVGAGAEGLALRETLEPVLLEM